MTLSPVGDVAVNVSFGSTVDEVTLAQVRSFAQSLADQRLAGVVDVLPAFASVTVYYDITQLVSYADFCVQLERRLRETAVGTVAANARSVLIPVCYEDPDFGPDLSLVARHCGLSPAEVIRQHVQPDYAVHAIGFSPGFAYLGGLLNTLHTPRQATPRTRVAAGSVGIGGGQTGVYPRATPGGWNLIGRTPVAFFDFERREAAWLKTGDRVRFHVISREQYDAWK